MMFSGTSGVDSQIEKQAPIVVGRVETREVVERSTCDSGSYYAETTSFRQIFQ